MSKLHNLRVKGGEAGTLGGPCVDHRQSSKFSFIIEPKKY